jgi:hypothetical protein
LGDRDDPDRPLSRRRLHITAPTEIAARIATATKIGTRGDEPPLELDEPLACWPG